MKFLTSIITFSFLLNFTAFSQNLITQVKPMGKKEWGYINSKGEMVIDAKYRKCYKFSSEGLAPIYEGKKWFFIKTNGEQLSTEASKFSVAEGFFGAGLQGFSDGLVMVRVDKKMGYLDTEGKVAIDFKYEKATSFDGGYATVKKGGDFYVINKNGEETKIEVSGIDDVKQFSEGLAPFYTDDKSSGFINPDGTVAIKAQFATVGYFVDGLAWAKTTDKKVGYIDKTGEWVIKPSFLAAKDFDPVSGMARVKNETSWGYVNKNGEPLNITTETYGDFYEGLAKGRVDGKFGFYNASGDWVIKPQFDGARDFKNGYAAAKKGETWGFIDKTGEWVVDPKYAAVKDLELVN